ncbi:hypothetical protein LPYR103PRE_07690 [Segatella asaccharophila]
MIAVTEYPGKFWTFVYAEEVAIKATVHIEFYFVFVFFYPLDVPTSAREILYDETRYPFPYLIEYPWK